MTATKSEVCPSCGSGAQYGEDCPNAFHNCRACIWKDGDRLSICRDCAEIELEAEGPDPEPEPIPMLLWCPLCHARHLDVGEFATKPHTSHSCQTCGLTWKPAKVPTVGVQFLPGYKNE